MKTLRQRRTTARAARPAHTAPTNAHAVEVAEQNRSAVARALGAPVQAKLTLGAPDDTQEHEADRFAASVMRSPGGAEPQTLQRSCSDCAQEEEVQRKDAPAPVPEDEREEDKLQRKIGAEAGASAGAAVADATAATINSQRGGGQPLPGSERRFFEARVGSPLDHVRVHTDGGAARLAGSLGARAFTVGRDVFFGAGEYRPGSFSGRWLMAHELAHVGQQGAGVVRRWTVGTAPAPDGWEVVTDAEQLRRLGQAEGIVRGVLGSRRCQNYYGDHCAAGFGDNPLQAVFDNTEVYLRPHDDNAFGESIPGAMQSAFNLRAFRIGRYFMASTMLHELFHNCDPDAPAGRADELRAENAVERCRLYTPWIDHVRPRRAAVGARITIHGWNLGPTQGPADSVRVGGIDATVISWTFLPGTTSAVEIVVEVPSGAASGPVVVFNNRVASNAAALTVI